VAESQIANNGLSSNGLSSNGLSSNGLSSNGLSSNGLSSNGLSSNGLSSNGFQSWFLGQAGGTAYSDMVMTYVVKCAAPAGSTISTTVNGVTYNWAGELGLAPQWTAGNPIPTIEQQLISACLAAHANRFGVHVNISVLGYASDGSPIPTSAQELLDYPVREGCFFGNLFTGDGVFVGNDSYWGTSNSSVRDCAITVSGSPNDNCPPMVFAGACAQLCASAGDPNAYSSCTYNGTTYASINTRIAASDIYQCGDHTCQVSESCGTGLTPNNCEDCGSCQ
jgi:hypothetical protein